MDRIMDFLGDFFPRSLLLTQSLGSIRAGGGTNELVQSRERHLSSDGGAKRRREES